MGDKLFGTTDILAKGLQAAWMRNDALANNIANVDTPGYKRSDVAFEELLQSALDGDISEINPSQLQPYTYTDKAELSYRLDGNNVDIDTEMAELAKNQIRYNTMITSINSKFSRIKEAMNLKG